MYYFTQLGNTSSIGLPSEFSKVEWVEVHMAPYQNYMVLTDAHDFY